MKFNFKRFNRDYWNTFFAKLQNKYRLVIMNQETFEEKISFSLTKINVFVLITTLSLLLIILTTVIIAYTPLREYIPGYASVDLKRNVYNLKLQADSLSRDAQQKEIYLNNLRKILNDEVIDDETNYTNANQDPTSEKVDVDPRSLVPSVQDSIFRKEVESQIKYFGQTINQKAGNASPNVIETKKSIKDMFFFTPIVGYISNVYNPQQNHLGIDIVSAPNQPIKSIKDGYVILSEWTLKTGNVIAVQHSDNLISVYKHNSVLFKKQGDHVQAGEVIAVVGNTGTLTSGTHLHFEMWYNGVPVDPREYIMFRKNTLKNH